MHFSNILLVHLVYFIGTIAAFSNTAPIFIKRDYDTPGLPIKNKQFFKPFEWADTLMSVMYENDEYNENANHVVSYYQVAKEELEPKLNNLNQEGLGLHVSNVVYFNQSETVFNVFKARGVLPELLSGESLDRVLQEMNSYEKSDIVLQAVPDFKSSVNAATSEEKLENLFDFDDKLVRDEGKGDVSVEQEIVSDFAEANRLAAEEDEPVTILEDTPSNSTTIKHDNLFTNYQFFTTGIWSGLIVSGFLLLILYGALTWLSDLQITYASFEKQVDFDKKNE
ncbi:hypothetical protein CANMA_005249 [Candida margitis]|uniref:uncharacterized protein n=1 Tax=Candida margitis TaxID=1775924 RepID=UPI0022274809|nr:uncharacterized protein CANMA_005249 [Candida margitis]KAI5950589.1 hypothetical protein CANMA_005249 [Candida margitis]